MNSVPYQKESGTRTWRTWKTWKTRYHQKSQWSNALGITYSCDTETQKSWQCAHILPNCAIQRERYITPTVDDLIHDLNDLNAVCFTKLDLNAGYHQLELHPDSRYITTFTTHVGLWRYTRLNFGISSAAEVFQNTIQQVLHGIPNVRNMSDDIIVYGKTRD